MTHPAARRVRNRLILSARLIVAEHWPAADGRCPICRLPDCRALATASAYLAAVHDPFVPPQPSIDVVDIDSRAVVPPPETTTAAPGEDADRAEREGAG